MSLFGDMFKRINRLLKNYLAFFMPVRRLTDYLADTVTLNEEMKYWSTLSVCTFKEGFRYFQENYDILGRKYVEHLT